VWRFERVLGCLRNEVVLLDYVNRFFYLRFYLMVILKVIIFRLLFEIFYKVC
jgi:hypothetical protein